MIKFIDDIYTDRGEENKQETGSKKIIIRQTIGFVIFLVVGTAVLFLGFRQIKFNIQGFSRLNSQAQESRSQADLTELYALQNKDSDADGLSDFNELYVYKTSPYLEDTDSDGYSDKTEVEAGHDPLCPAGQDCYGAGAKEASDSQTVQKDLILPAGVSSVQDLRRELESAGIPRDTLDQVDDATLVELYNQTVEDTGTNPVKPTGGDLSDYSHVLNSLDTNQIRELLIESGVDKAMLEQVDDESLKQLFLETLKEQGE